MKNKAYQFLIAFFMGLSFLMAATTAEARQCRWVGGYWHNGHYVKGHKVCWSRGYHRHHRHHGHCRWHNGHRVCYR